MGFFLITLDISIVNVALAQIRAELGGGTVGQQWIIDGYTLLFAALLLFAGNLSDRIGAKKAMALGIALFGVTSAACAFAPTTALLIAARCAQGAGAAIMLPASMALVREAFPDPARRAKALGVWAVGGAVAGLVGQPLGGLVDHVRLALGVHHQPAGLCRHAHLPHRGRHLPDPPGPVRLGRSGPRRDRLVDAGLRPDRGRPCRVRHPPSGRGVDGRGPRPGRLRARPVPGPAPDDAARTCSRPAGSGWPCRWVSRSWSATTATCSWSACSCSRSCSCHRCTPVWCSCRRRSSRSPPTWPRDRSPTATVPACPSWPA